MSAEEDSLLAIFSGGTGFNETSHILKSLTQRTTHILPVSDDGGSTKEIVNWIYAPALGDLRSRIVRLAEEDHPEERDLVKVFLKHRLTRRDCESARAEWMSVLEGRHPLWDGIPEMFQDTIRAYFVHFNHSILKHLTNARRGNENSNDSVRREQFDFRNGSLGNFMLAGALLFFDSIEAAVFLVSRVLRVSEKTRVLPIINKLQPFEIAAEVESQTGTCIVLRGQNQISHPSGSKDDAESLGGCIRKIYYCNRDGQETTWHGSTRVLQELGQAHSIVYAMGSLFTSIIPCLIVKGVGEIIASKPVSKTLILNGNLDRETENMDAMDFIHSVTSALNRYGELSHKIQSYFTHLIVPDVEVITVDAGAIDKLGIKIVPVSCTSGPDPNDTKKITARYDDHALAKTLVDLTNQQ